MQDKKDALIEQFIAAAEKFVSKVETGRARSVETYGDLKACLQEAGELGFRITAKVTKQ